MNNLYVNLIFKLKLALIWQEIVGNSQKVHERAKKGENVVISCLIEVKIRMFELQMTFHIIMFFWHEILSIKQTN